MSNLVTEVNRAVQFETITKQAHEANLQALKDGKIIEQDEFLKLIEVEPKLRWMNENLKKWATGIANTRKSSISSTWSGLPSAVENFYSDISCGFWRGNYYYITIPKLQFTPKYIIIPEYFIIAIDNNVLVMGEQSNWEYYKFDWTATKQSFVNNEIFVGNFGGQTISKVQWIAFE